MPLARFFAPLPRGKRSRLELIANRYPQILPTNKDSAGEFESLWMEGTANDKMTQGFLWHARRPASGHYHVVRRLP